MRSHALDRTQVLPFSGATDLQFRIARSFALITDWNAALHGAFALEDVIKVLTRQTEALRLSITRLEHDTALPVGGSVHPLSMDVEPHSSGAILRYLRDTRRDLLVPGSVWRLSEMSREEGFDRSAAAAEWRRNPDVVAVSTLILEAADGRIDAIEMVFGKPPNTIPELPTELVTQALADAWSVRAPGLVSRLIRSQTRRRGRSPDKAETAILSEHNPCGLSRSEQRLCYLLVAGEKAKDIAVTLGISMATVRTHLRNIYSKTETSGQVELIAQINAEKGWAA